MAYRVILEATAQQDALDYAAYIIQESQEPSVAAKWLLGLEEAIESLAEMPRRFRIIDEEAEFSLELRQFVYHSHRVIFHVKDDDCSVHVLRIYHALRDAVQLTDLPLGMP